MEQQVNAGLQETLVLNINTGAIQLDTLAQLNSFLEQIETRIAGINRGLGRATGRPKEFFEGRLRGSGISQFNFDDLAKQFDVQVEELRSFWSRLSTTAKRGFRSGKSAFTTPQAAQFMAEFEKATGTPISRLTRPGATTGPATGPATLPVRDVEAVVEGPAKLTVPGSQVQAVLEGIVRLKIPANQVQTEAAASAAQPAPSKGRIARTPEYQATRDELARALREKRSADRAYRQAEAGAFTREKANAIAKDLIEGGINSKGTTKLTAEAHGVPIETVRMVRRTLLKGYKANKLILGKEDADRYMLSNADAIENRWEDDNLGITQAKKKLAAAAERAGLATGTVKEAAAKEFIMRLKQRGGQDPGSPRPPQYQAARDELAQALRKLRSAQRSGGTLVELYSDKLPPLEREVEKLRGRVTQMKEALRPPSPPPGPGGGGSGPAAGSPPGPGGGGSGSGPAKLTVPGSGVQAVLEGPVKLIVPGSAIQALLEGNVSLNVPGAQVQASLQGTVNLTIPAQRVVARPQRTEEQQRARTELAQSLRRARAGSRVLRTADPSSAEYLAAREQVAAAQREIQRLARATGRRQQQWLGAAQRGTNLGNVPAPAPVRPGTTPDLPIRQATTVNGPVNLTIPSNQVRASVAGMIDLVIPAAQIRATVAGAVPAAVPPGTTPPLPTTSPSGPVGVTISSSLVRASVAGLIDLVIPAAQIRATVSGTIPAAAPAGSGGGGPGGGAAPPSAGGGSAGGGGSTPPGAAGAGGGTGGALVPLPSVPVSPDEVKRVGRQRQRSSRLSVTRLSQLGQTVTETFRQTGALIERITQTSITAADEFRNNMRRRMREIQGRLARDARGTTPDALRAKAQMRRLEADAIRTSFLAAAPQLPAAKRADLQAEADSLVAQKMGQAAAYEDAANQRAAQVADRAREQARRGRLQLQQIMLDADERIREQFEQDMRRMGRHYAERAAYARLLNEGYQPSGRTETLSDDGRRRRIASTFSRFNRATGMRETRTLTTSLYDGQYESFSVRSKQTPLDSPDKQYGLAAQRFNLRDFAANTMHVGRWALSVMVLYKAVELLARGMRVVMDVGLQTARLEQVFSGIGGSAKELVGDTMALSAVMGQNSSEAIESAIAWSRLGLTRQKVNEAVRVSLLAANVAEVSVTEATTKLQAVMAAYQLTVTDLNSVLASLNETSNNFNVTNKDLLDGLARTASVARQAGLPLAELVGLIAGGVGTTGQTGTQIGNAIKSITVSLSNPEIQGFLRSGFNIETRTSTGDLKPLNQILREIKLKYDELNTAERQSLVVRVAAKTQASRFVAILESYTQAMVLAANAQVELNSAEVENEKITKTLTSNLQGLKNVADLFTVRIFSTWAQDAANMANALRDVWLWADRVGQRFEQDSIISAGLDKLFGAGAGPTGLRAFSELTKPNFFPLLPPAIGNTAQVLINRISSPGYGVPDDKELDYLRSKGEASGTKTARELAELLAERAERGADISKDLQKLQQLSPRFDFDSEIANLPQAEKVVRLRQWAAELAYDEQTATEQARKSRQEILDLLSAQIAKASKRGDFREASALELDRARLEGEVIADIGDEVLDAGGYFDEVKVKMEQIDQATKQYAATLEGLASNEVGRAAAKIAALRAALVKVNAELAMKPTGQLDAQLRDRRRELEMELEVARAFAQPLAPVIGPPAPPGPAAMADRMAQTLRLSDARFSAGEVGTSRTEQLINARVAATERLLQLTVQLTDKNRSNLDNLDATAESARIISSLEENRLQLIERQFGVSKDMEEMRRQARQEEARALIGADPEEMLRRVAARSLQPRNVNEFFTLSPGVRQLLAADPDSGFSPEGNRLRQEQATLSAYLNGGGLPQELLPEATARIFNDAVTEVGNALARLSSKSYEAAEKMLAVTEKLEQASESAPHSGHSRRFRRWREASMDVGEQR